MQFANWVLFWFTLRISLGFSRENHARKSLHEKVYEEGKEYRRRKSKRDHYNWGGDVQVMDTLKGKNIEFPQVEFPCNTNNKCVNLSLTHLRIGFGATKSNPITL